MDEAEPTVANVWAFMASWFTPTVLFCLLNLIIGTIFITHHNHHQPPPPAEDGDYHNPTPPRLVRAPSFLQRLRSFDFSLYRSEHPDPLQPPSHHPDPPHEEAPSHDPHVTRSKSDKTGEASPARSPANMKKSRSEKLKVEEEEVEEVDRQQTVSSGEDEEGVDAKADDFINRFKQQLKLQRLDSIMRYREMLKRGLGK